MNFWNLKENEFSENFYGKFSLLIEHDDCSSKSTGVKISGNVRSLQDKQNIILVGYIPKRHNNTPIKKNTGLNLTGIIRDHDGPNSKPVDVLHLLSYRMKRANTISAWNVNFQATDDPEHFTIAGMSEFDDIVFNLNEEDYNFKVTYYLESLQDSKYIRGFSIKIPRDKYNTFIARNKSLEHYISCRAMQ